VIRQQHTALAFTSHHASGGGGRIGLRLVISKLFTTGNKNKLFVENL